MTDQSTISQLNPILVLADADLLLADQSQGDGTYVTKKITAANVSAKFSAEAGAAASGYADDAATSAADADSSATSASTSAATATTKAGVATTKAGDAASSAAAAATSETNAATSETNAATSETNAAASAAAAAISETNAAASATLATVTGANLFGRGPVSSTVTSLPASPVEGDRYLVAHSGTSGALVGKEDQLVEYVGGAWVYSGVPKSGQHLFVSGTKAHLTYSTGWVRRSKQRIRTSEFETVDAAEAFRVSASINELHIDSPWTLTADTTLSGTTTIAAGIDPIVTGAFNLNIAHLGGAPRSRIFDNSGVGSVTLGGAIGYPEWFGAKGDGVCVADDDGSLSLDAGYTDDYLALRAIINSGVREVRLAGKVYATNSTIEAPVDLIISGTSRNKSILAVGATETTILTCVPDEAGGELGLKDLTLLGYMGKSLTANTSGGNVFVRGVSNFWCKNVRSLYAEYMSIAAVATVARFQDGEIGFSGRDSCNFTGSDIGYIQNSYIHDCADDGGAMHLNSAANGPVKTRLIATGNTLERTFGFDVLGARNSIIAKNIGRYIYGYWARITPSNIEGVSSNWNVTIANNIVSDLIDPTLLGLATNPACFIWVGASTTAGTSTDHPAVAPETYDATGKTFVDPFPYYDQMLLGTTPIGPGFNTKIVNNSYSNLLNGLTKFSDAGVGKLWGPNGPVDPAMTGTVGNGFVLRFDGDTSNVYVAGDQAYGVASYVRIQTPGTITNNIRFSNVHVARAPYFVLSDHTVAATYLDMQFEDCSFDGDPLFENADRKTAEPDGTWTASAGANSCFAYIPYCIGMQFRRCGLKNVGLDFKTNGTTQFLAEDMRYYWDFVSGKGIGAINDTDMAAQQFHYWIDSDPTSATYLQPNATTDSAFLRQAAAAPTSGNFYPGAKVKNTSIASAAATYWRCSASPHTFVAGPAYA